MELKRMGSGGGPSERAAREALGQIHRGRYYHGMEGSTVLYGIAFDSKSPTVVSEEISL